MRALCLERVGTPLVLLERPDPRPGQICVVVRVLGVRVLSYARATLAPFGGVASSGGPGIAT